MLGFLQGFSYGLFMTCLPWLLVGLFNPGLALPVLAPSRLQVIFRYCLLVPFISMLMWLTSLWGGFSPSLFGWLAGGYCLYSCGAASRANTARLAGPTPRAPPGSSTSGRGT
ncbi:hypothetical protein [Halomonas sp. HAL1]|uniref:hypothetical protein n=1 Tax=Halomonas sp. HAL1 TaxID=550984 RepID=UPI001EE63974|nr:hypothetical protein [Halomonas sp. HAL1]WKV92662.1 hypothetical protein Q3Y66_17710 [Halomonas sp. HAL1]